MHKYYSLKNGGYSTPATDDFSYEFWDGFRKYMKRKIDDCSFAHHFPKYCPDGNASVATDENKFWEAFRFELPEAAEYLFMEEEPGEWWPVPTAIADTIEFCYKYIAKPSEGRWHDYFNHNHLSFDERAGKEEFRNYLLHIFDVHGLNYTLTEEGCVERVGNPAFADLLDSPVRINDEVFDGLIQEAYSCYHSVDSSRHKMALEKAVDALERLESLAGGREQLSCIVCNDTRPTMNKVIKAEISNLFEIANKAQIRHYKHNTEPMDDSLHIDYLFIKIINFMKLYISSNPSAHGKHQ